jgi:hypothetical protein
MLSQALKKIIERAGSVIIVEHEQPAYVVMKYADYEALMMGTEQPDLWAQQPWGAAPENAAPQPPRTVPAEAENAASDPHPVDVSAISLDDLPF